MECPNCQSRKIRKDYAPPRGYALAIVGLILIALARVVNPAILMLPDASASQRWLIAGILVLAYGMMHLVRHGNRFCGVCGFKFREIQNQPYAVGSSTRSRTESAGKYADSSAGSASADTNSGTLNPNTPIEPILACLRFNDPAMRVDAAASLKKLTGQDFGEDADAWNCWWKENKEQYKAMQKAARK